MHTVELLAEASAAAQRLGYRVRREWLGGLGGVCELRGQKWLFLDDAWSPAEQLDVVLEALRADPGVLLLPLEPELARFVDVRRCA